MADAGVMRGVVLRALGASWGDLGSSWAPLGSLWESCWALFGPSDLQPETPHIPPTLVLLPETPHIPPTLVFPR